MRNCEEIKVKLTNIQLTKLKSAAKSETGTTLRIIKEKFQSEELPHELFLTIRQITKISYAFTNNMPTDVKFIKTQIFKIIKLRGFFGTLLGKLDDTVIMVAVPPAKNVKH